MRATIASNYTVFEEHIRQIEQGIQFFQLAGTVKRCAADAIDRTNGKPYAIGEITKFMRIDDYPERQFCNAYFMCLVAGFEEFLRQTLEAAITGRAKKVRSFDELGSAVQDLHMKATGYLLSRKDNPPQQLHSLDFYQVCQNLGTCVPGATSFTLNPEAISITRSLLDLDSLLDTLNKFGYQISWDKLGNDSDMKDCMKAKKARETAKLAKRYVAEMVRQRNRVAHTGSSSDITVTVLKDHLTCVRSLASAITRCLTS